MSNIPGAGLTGLHASFEAALPADPAISADKLSAALDRAAGTTDPSAQTGQGNSASTPPAPSLVLGQGALNAADDAWVNVVALTEELHKADLPPEQKARLLSDLAQNWQIFQQRSGPILEEVKNLISQE